MNCSNDCGSCKSGCGQPQSLKVEPNKRSKIGKVIAVVSGKGGVGKSLTTSMLAVAMNRKGYRSAILDADITGPSIPKAFGLEGGLEGCEDGIFPKTSQTGIDMVSINFVLDNVDDPVVYRGPIIAQTVKQFWADVIWEDIDYMFVDMPPGTGDVPLTVFQSMPVDGIIIMTSPQDLVSMIVGKAVKMAKMMDIPILGVIENYSYLACPDCQKKIELFGNSKTEQSIKKYDISLLAKLPLDPKLAMLVDDGAIEDAKLPNELENVVKILEKLRD